MSKKQGVRARFLIIFFFPRVICGQDLEAIEELEPTVVEAERAARTADFLPIPAEILSGPELRSQVQGTVGETLGWQPGVNSAFYGAGASRPVIRGFDGFRIRMLRDSVGTLDVSASSPDHGLPIEPFLLREIELTRGPAALLYGNAALGGAVNMHTRNLITARAGERFSGGVESRFETAASGWGSFGYLQVEEGDWLFNVTTSWREAGKYRIPGRARTSAYESLFAPQINDPTLGTVVPIPNPSGRMPNTALQSHSWSVGAAWFPEAWPLELSAAVSQFDSDYGLPFVFGGDPNDLFGDSSLDLDQTRFDGRAVYRGETDWLRELTFHLGIADYRHRENFRGRGKDQGLAFTDTRFEQKGWEMRLDWLHEPTSQWSGVAGIQASGTELNPSFLAAPPRPDSRFLNRFESWNLGLFANEKFTQGDWEFSGSLRYETQKIRDLSGAAFGFTRSRHDHSVSAALGSAWEREAVGSFDRLKFSLTGSAINRLPTETERYAFWANPAIQRFLIGGDLDGTPLANEFSLGLDLGMEADWQDFRFRANVFSYRIDDFVFLQDLRGIGNQAGYQARDAAFFGMESEFQWAIFDHGSESLRASLMADWVRASERSGGDPLPRIPPFRIGSRIDYQRGDFTSGLELRYAFSQDLNQPATAVAQGELATDGYLEVNWEASYQLPLASGDELTFFLQVRNLLDEERRLHTSFLKDVAPLPGRNAVLGVRFEF